MRLVPPTLLTIFLIVTSAPVCALNYELEPNNSAAQATPIALGQAVQGNIGSQTDVDDYKVTATTSSSLRVLFRRPPRSYQYNIAKLRVLDSVGTELSSVDAYAPDVYTSFDVGVDAGSTYTIEVTGCQVADQQSECGRHRSQVYELIVLNLPAPTFETEPNGSIAQADVLPPNGWAFAQHSSEADLDFFRVDLPSAGDFFAQLSRPSDPYEYSLSNIAILDQAGNLLNSDDVYAANGQGRVVVSVKAAATLYIRVTSCSSGSRCDIVFSNPYQIVSGFRAASPCDLVFVNGFDCSAPVAGAPLSLWDATTMSNSALPPAMVTLRGGGR